MPLPVNAILQGGKYKIVRHLSSGGFGVTYEAEHTLLHHRVAIKEFFVKDFCNRDEQTNRVTVATQGKTKLVERLKKKFVDEASAIFGLSHPNIVHVFDVFEENDTAYYVMDFISGLSLQQIVKQSGPLPEAEAVGYIRQVADALSYIHARNRLHLDIKPGNIMVNNDGQAILIDFGASKQYDEVDGENTSTLTGKTPGFAPLEQMSNTVRTFSPSTDIYSLGATLYKLLTGITPPNASDIAEDPSVLLPLPATISPTVRHAVEQSMQLARKNRPQNIAEFLALLDAKPQAEETVAEEVVNISVDDSRTHTHPPTPRPKPKSNKLWIAVCSISIVLVIFSVLFIKYGTGRDVTSNGSDKVEGDSIVSFTVNDITFNMVKVHGGTFIMGANSDDNEFWDDEIPRHQVTLSDYYIGQTEVTQALWKAVMENTPSHFKGDNLPVENVSWNDCQIFISRLNSLTGQTFSLPTEAEWEFAARDGYKDKGYKFSGSNSIDAVAWYSKNSNRKTHVVATKQANDLGIYDMTGNVWEWCSDCYKRYSSSPQTNPIDSISGYNHVSRGGSWRYDARYNRISNRGNKPPEHSNNNIGLRLSMHSMQ